MERALDGYRGLSTIAVFLSSVTASTLQYSTQLTPKNSLLSLVVNLLWFVSLVASISSAIGSQLAISWNSSPYRTPPQNTPFLINTIMGDFPLALLAIASILLLAGVPFYLFEFFGRPSLVVPLLVTLTVFTLLGYLLMAGCWQLSEVWAGHGHSLFTWFHQLGPKFLDVRMEDLLQCAGLMLFAGDKPLA